MKNDKRTLEKDLSDLLGTGKKARIAARCYGFDGRGGRSFRAEGHSVRLTRERIRQIADEISKRLTGRPVPAALDQTIGFVIRRIRAAAAEIEGELRSQGLTSRLFRLEGVIKAAELLGRNPGFSITKVNGVRLVHGGQALPNHRIIRIARRTISRWGMATVSQIAAEVRKIDSAVCDRKVVASVLSCLGGFAWLDQSTGWFWLSDNRNNPVLNRLRKMLSIASPISVSDLQTGLARDRRMKAFSIPREVFLELCRQAPGLRVDDCKIEASPGINTLTALTQTERAVIHLVLEHGGTIATSEFKSACHRMGLNKHTSYLCLLQSPLIAKYADGLYGLVGLRSRPDLIPGSDQNHGR